MRRLAEFSFVALILRRFRHQAAADGQDHSQVTPDSKDDFGYSFDPHSINLEKPSGPRSTFDTSLVFKQPKEHGDLQEASFAYDGFGTEPMPKDFNIDAFLSRAQATYKIIKASSGGSELNEIRHLTTNNLFSQIKDQLQQDKQPNKTEIFNLNAQILYIHELDPEWEAAVLFDSTVQEPASQDPNQTREIWHFILPINSQNSTWLLDGIQQLND